jgi:hypothetical protein
METKPLPKTYFVEFERYSDVTYNFDLMEYWKYEVVYDKIETGRIETTVHHTILSLQVL